MGIQSDWRQGLQVSSLEGERELDAGDGGGRKNILGKGDHVNKSMRALNGRICVGVSSKVELK